jgi:hypothetical protein
MYKIVQASPATSCEKEHTAPTLFAGAIPVNIQVTARWNVGGEGRVRWTADAFPGKAAGSVFAAISSTAYLETIQA